MSLTQDQVIDYLSTLTVMDIVNLTKALEDKWGVKAAPVAVAGPAAAAGPARPPPRRRPSSPSSSRARARSDQRHQGRPRDHRPGSQGRQGPGRRRPEGRQGRRAQGRGRGHRQEAQGRRRRGRGQVVRRSRRTRQSLSRNDFSRSQPGAELARPLAWRTCHFLRVPCYTHAAPGRGARSSPRRRVRVARLHARRSLDFLDFPGSLDDRLLTLPHVRRPPSLP
jgi:hypothetical protein